MQTLGAVDTLPALREESLRTNARKAILRNATVLHLFDGDLYLVRPVRKYVLLRRGELWPAGRE